MKSGNLNFLKPSGPLQACNGTALPFFITLTDKVMHPEAVQREQVAEGLFRVKEQGQL